MIKVYDRLEKKYSELALKDGDKKELKEISDEIDELIKNMSDKEIKELLNRPYPSQYKAKIKQIRGE